MRAICVDSLDELADYKEQWEDLRKRCGGSIYTSYPLSELWLEVFSRVVSPRVLILEDKGDIVAIAPMALQQYSIAKMPIKMLTLIGDMDMRLGLNTLRVLSLPDRPNIMDEVMGSIAELDWNILRTNFMEDTDDTRQLLELFQSTWKCDGDMSSPTITCHLPKEGDITSCFGKSTRSKLRQQIRRLEREGRLELRPVPSYDMDRAVRTYTRQHIERWSTKGGSIFLDPENVDFLTRAMELSVRNGFGFAYELLIDKEVAAQQFGFIDRGCACGYRSGMNNSFHSSSPGKLLTYYVMTDMRDRGLTMFNLGEGGEEYKYHMGGQARQLVGQRAKRGMVSVISTVADSTMMRNIDSLLMLRKRLLRERTNRCSAIGANGAELDRL